MLALRNSFYLSSIMISSVPFITFILIILLPFILILYKITLQILILSKKNYKKIEESKFIFIQNKFDYQPQ